MEEILALFESAEETQTPFIVQTTPVARNYADWRMLIAMIDDASIKYPQPLFTVTPDHGNTEHCLQSIQYGKYNSVMIDGSHLPLEDNIRCTKEIVQKASPKGIHVEAELGVLSGVEDDIIVSEDEKKYTNPNEVCRFVEQTDCNSLAVAVGTSHGAYKFKGEQGIQFDILKDIQNKLPGFPLVLHGGSAININEVERINAAGGKMKTDSKGVQPNEIKKAIQYGVCKVNIASDLRLVHTRVHREFFKNEPELFDPIIPGKKYMEALKIMFTDKFELLGAIGKNEEIKVKI